MNTENYSAYFDDVRDECILECKSHTLEETANGMFSRTEIVESLFKKQESSDEAFSIIVDLMHLHLSKSINCDSGNIYVPGTGPGGLSRRIAKEFPESKIFTVDSSIEMVAACRKNSLTYDNIDVSCADIRDVNIPQKFDAIIAYGIMRYIPENSRGDLIDSWNKNLKSEGMILVGEGVAKSVVERINSENYSRIEMLERNAKLFRCSLFYTLNSRYHKDDIFRRRVGVAIYDMRCHGNVSYADVLADIAGYTQSKVYLKIFKK
jgi:hypothetical protein